MDTSNWTVEQWLGEDNVIGVDIFKRKYLRPGETLDMWFDRISGGDQEVRELVAARKFLFGGRVLANRGTDTTGSLSNCYSIGYCPDDYAGIMDVAKKLGLTYKGQGGQGVSMTMLRPKGAPIGKDYTSDGIIPFMKIFNEITDSTSQGGARKGALMISLDARHKEAMEFITVKSGQGIIEKANLSLEIDDTFMQAVEQWYETGEEVVLHEKRHYGVHTVEYDVVPIQIFRALVENAWDWGDPACLFVDEFRNRNIMEFVDEYQVETSNPCGEQPLPKHAACCLGSINLAEFVMNPYTQDAAFDYEGFHAAVKVAVRALDDIVEENLVRHPLPEQTEMARSYRNIGLGVLGYANMLMMMGLTYGGKKALEMTDELFDDMFKTAVRASADLAVERGKFPAYNNKVFLSRIIKEHFDAEEIKELKQKGLRNCSLLSVAPTGSLSTFLGRSGGVEPEYAIKFTRRTVGATEGQDTYYDIFCKTAQEYLDAHEGEELPGYFITSVDIPSDQRIAVQAVMQKHVDTAISSTVNLPESATKEDVAWIFLQAWRSKLKGITIFRDGCKKLGILTTGKTEAPSQDKETETLKRGYVLRHSDNNMIRIRTIQSGCGKVYVHAHFDPETGDLIELFLDRGGSGGCERYMNGLSRMTSLAARGGIGTAEIIDQMMSVGQCAAYIRRRVKEGDASKGACCPNAIGFALEEMWDDVRQSIPAKKNGNGNGKNAAASALAEQIKHEEGITNYARCPECKQKTLTQEGGCNVCKACGYSRCD